MPVFRIHRMKEGPRQQFRWAPHVSGAANVKPKDYEAAGEIEAENEYAAWALLRGSETPLHGGRPARTRDRPAAHLQVRGLRRSALVYTGGAGSGAFRAAAAGAGAPVRTRRDNREILMRAARLGDDIDDFCVKCKRVMNHAVVSILNDEPAKVRCRTCHSDHDFRHEQAPPPKVDPRKAALFNQVLANVTGAPELTTPASGASPPAAEPVDRPAEPPAERRAATSGAAVSTAKPKAPQESQGMKTLFVTGGAGFIGSEFIRQAIERYRIINFDKLTYAGNLDNLASVAENPNYSLVVGDVCDAAAVAAALPENCDAIVHFAAESHVDRSILSAEEFVRTNVLGTQVMLDVARHRKAKRFLHISTDEVGGDMPPDGWFHEDSPLDARTAPMPPARPPRNISCARRRVLSAWIC